MLDNEAYETTGNQDTTSSSTDFCQTAKACGYSDVFQADSEEALRKNLKQMLSQKGPVLLRIKINRVTETKSARITTKYNCGQITENFKGALKGGL